MKRGFTLVELLVAMAVIGFVVLGSLSLLIAGMKGFQRTAMDADLSTTNSQTMRLLTENLRNATSLKVSSDGKRIDYTLPKFTGFTDPATGEKELVVPVQSDGVARAYVVDFAKKQLTDTTTGKAVLTEVASVDPDQHSTQYQKSYVPFALLTAGSVKAVTINLITSQKLISEDRYSKFKTTVILHNYK